MKTLSIRTGITAGSWIIHVVHRRDAYRARSVRTIRRRSDD